MAGPAQRCDLICIDEWEMRDWLQYGLRERGLTCAIGSRKDMEDR